MNDDPSYFVKDVIEKSQYGRSSEWKVKLNRLKTDAASATWCRSPGTFEGVIVLEYLIEQIAHELNLDANKVRLANMDNGSALDKILPEFLKDTGTNVLNQLFFLSSDNYTAIFVIAQTTSNVNRK